MSEPDEVSIFAALDDGRKIPCHTARCMHCGNEWFVEGSRLLAGDREIQP